jgi:hypothetical protein
MWSYYHDASERRYKKRSEAHTDRMGGLCGGYSFMFVRNFFVKSVRKKFSRLWLYYRKFKRRRSYWSLKRLRRKRFKVQKFQFQDYNQCLRKERIFIIRSHGFLDAGDHGNPNYLSPSCFKLNALS